MRNKIITKPIRLIAYCILFLGIYSCSPKLPIFEIEEKINDDYTAHFEGDIEHMIRDTPTKLLKKYGEKGLRKKLMLVFNDSREYPVGYSNIGELDVKREGKCRSYRYYDVTYLVTKSQMTPFIDSTALKLNYKEYGKENVYLNPSSKILHVTERKHTILVYDRDKNWKILSYDIKFLEEAFGKKFSDCLESNEN